MKNKILSLIRQKGFSYETTDKDIKSYLHNYYSFHILLKKDNMCEVSFNGMKPTFGKSKNVNQAYEKFISTLNDYDVKYSISNSFIETL